MVEGHPVKVAGVAKLDVSEVEADDGIVSAQGGEIYNITRSGYFSSGATWVMDGKAVLFGTDRYGMRSHASWGSQEDVMIAFLTQDAYDKFRMSKEDYELVKEVEKAQKKDDKATKDDKKKGGKKGKKNEGKDEDKGEADKKAAEVKIEFDGLCDRIVRLTADIYSIRAKNNSCL